MGECVCGFDPPEDPNSDCERCGFVCTIQQQATKITKLQSEIRFQCERNRSLEAEVERAKELAL